jgi:hypothetical protein
MGSLRTYSGDFESESAVGEYRRIANEIARTLPRRYPIAAAEVCRALLMIGIGLYRPETEESAAVSILPTQR